MSIYVNSGAKIIATGSYQINIDNLMSELKISADEAKVIIKRSVEIAIQARKESNQGKAIIYKDHIDQNKLLP